MTDSNHKKSPLGQALFDMMVDMNRAQVRAYQAETFTAESESKARRAVSITAARHRPMVLNSIKRQE